MKLESLIEVFNNKIFRIPDYQRGYSWGKSQLEDLWLDLEILEQNKDHYMGMLSVKPKPDKKNTYYVIDGQQRIVTLAILIRVISDKFKPDEWLNGQEVSDYIKDFLYKKTGSQGKITKMIFGYEVDNPSHIHFKTEILGLNNTDDSTPKNTLYTKNLSDAKTFLKEKIQDLGKAQLEKLLIKITENLKFNFYQIDDVLNEFVTFETMNNRGKPLSTLELLKNRLIYLSTLLPNYDDKERCGLRDDINHAWKTIYEYLGRNPKAIIKDDEFLQNHCFIYFKFDKNINKKYKDFLLKKHFTATNVANNKLTYSNIRGYVTDIQESVKHYYFIHNIKEDSQCPYTGEEKVIISKIYRLGFQSFKPLVVTLCSHTKYEKYRIELFQHIEKYIFTRFNLEFFQSGKGSTIFYHFANRFQENATRFQDSKLDVKVVLDLTQEIIYNFEKNDLWKAISKKFAEKIQADEYKFYYWRGLHYFLYEYEIYLQEQHRGEIKVEWEHVNTKTIEHIYPQTPDDESWKNAFENKDLLHDLGNLLLLPTTINSSLKNKPFKDKKNYFRKNSYSAIEVSESENWTPNEVLARREKMLEFMDKRWNIEISDRVIKLLDRDEIE